MADKKVWCVRGGTSDWSGHDLFLTEKVVALDEPFLPDLSQIPPAREMLKEWPPIPLNGVQLSNTKKMYGKIYGAVKEIYSPKEPPLTKAQLSRRVGHLVRLAIDAKQGDLVIYPGDLMVHSTESEKENKIYIGEIVSEYFYVACCFQHRRRVNWEERRKGRLPNKFGPVPNIASFTAINNKEQSDKIIRKWKRR